MKDLVAIPGGTFAMGSDRFYPEEAPVVRVSVDPSWMDATPVTNARFAEFVAATGHARDCQDFRVWAGIMGKKESHYVPTQGTGDTG